MICITNEARESRIEGISEMYVRLSDSEAMAVEFGYEATREVMGYLDMLRDAIKAEALEAELRSRIRERECRCEGLTLRNPEDRHAVRQMMNKAMCAYANWQDVLDNFDELVEQYGRAQVKLHAESLSSEYQATVRCIALFTKEHLPEVCQTVIDRASEDFGL